MKRIVGGAAILAALMFTGTDRAEAHSYGGYYGGGYYGGGYGGYYSYPRYSSHYYSRYYSPRYSRYKSPYYRSRDRMSIGRRWDPRHGWIYW